MEHTVGSGDYPTQFFTDEEIDLHIYTIRLHLHVVVPNGANNGLIYEHRQRHAFAAWHVEATRHRQCKDSAGLVAA